MRGACGFGRFTVATGIHPILETILDQEVVQLAYVAHSGHPFVEDVRQQSGAYRVDGRKGKIQILCIGLTAPGTVNGILQAVSPPMYSALIPVSYTHLTLPTILLVQISVVAVSLKNKHHE
eukprot:TRINITY_DN8496_c0_g1_i1.p2 TRINITY_DN8496_c0_g1~~TRINITY_DN8496_c0_g1_i1.p2  ORF type:complete len:121 (-),score=25.01 TRINITY_DN8496_c0_g1_i1:57-419(-)